MVKMNKFSDQRGMAPLAYMPVYALAPSPLQPTHSPDSRIFVTFLKTACKISGITTAINVFRFGISARGRIDWPCEPALTSFIRVEIPTTPARFEQCVCAITPMDPDSYDVLNVGPFAHSFADGKISLVYVV